MKHIPSNFTIEEILKTIPASPAFSILEDKIDCILDNINELEDRLEKTNRDFELMDEADTFKYDLLEKIQELCKENGSKKELVASINLAFEESQVEM